jgi:uncharacterized protein with HEPN domain
MSDDEKDLRAHLESLLALCEKAKLFSEQINVHTFFDEQIHQLAVAALIGQFGEASRRILRKFPDFVEKHPELPFAKAKGMRNRIAHEYESIDLKAVWRTFDQSIPQFEQALIPIIQAFDAKHGTP